MGLTRIVAAKYSSSLAAPGEAVGSIAAQSVGEPSTQMTLNTFHGAGAGANVTLGIPRLREIIMTASRELKTPTMSVPLNKSVSEAQATRLTRSFTKLTLNELIAARRGVTVKETLMRGADGMWQRAYFVTLKLHPAERIKTAFGLSLKEIAQVVAKNFVSVLSYQMKLELRRSSSDYDGDITVDGGGLSHVENTEKNEGADNTKSTENQFEDDDDDDDNDENINEEDGVKASRTQSDNYDDDEDEPKDSKETGVANNSDQQNDATDVDEDDEEPSFGGDGVKIDVKANTIEIQPLRVDPSSRPLLMIGLVEKAASKTLVRSKKDIDQAFVNTEEEGRGRCLQTAGINFTEMWKLENVDHNKLMSNDIWAVRCAYGVEAARNTIVNQIRSVFGVYGIEVDPRHLTLIADYMTFGGDYTPMNRTGMWETSSPFLQMSFETTAQFMTQAALTGASDYMNSPSANIVAGRPIRHGTGAFSLLVK